MSHDAQHAKARREYWIDGYLNAYQTPDDLAKNLVHVREVLPGEITITREELEPLLEYFAEYGSLALEVKLFGPAPEGTDANG